MNVFLDTQVIIEKGLNFNNHLFQKLIAASRDELISLYITEITVNEVKSKIKEQINKLDSSFKSFIKDAKMLRNLEEFSNIFTIENRLEEIYLSLCQQFDDFLIEANAEIIKVNEVDPSTIFALYFEGKAPFSAKKKSEFPDAFTLLALNKFFNSLEQECYIVSNDQDLKQYCEQSDYLIHKKSLESFFDTLTKDQNYNHNFIVTLFDENIEEIEGCVIDNFLQHSFTVSDEIGDIIKIEAECVELEEDPYIIDYHSDAEIAEIAFNATVEYKADISYFDPSTSYYDSEEHKYLFENYIEKKVKDIINVPVLLRIKYTSHDKTEMEILSSEINEGEIINIPIN